MIFALALTPIGLLLAFLLVISSSFGFPGGIITMIALGSLCKDIPSLILVMGVAFFASVFGDMLAYELARRISDKVEKRLRKFNFFVDNEQKARRLLSRYGFWIIFFTRFALVGLCAVISYICGLEKYNRKKFFLAVLAGEFFYALIYPLLGFTVGEVFSNLISAINDFAVVIVLLAVVFYLIRYFWKR